MRLRWIEVGVQQRHAGAHLQQAACQSSNRVRYLSTASCPLDKSPSGMTGCCCCLLSALAAWVAAAAVEELTLPLLEMMLVPVLLLRLGIDPGAP